MLTIFSLPKPFRGHTGIIQNNAIRSWARACPGCEIILLGDEEGTAETAAELGLRHIPDIKRNEYGTPLFSHMFELGQADAKFNIACNVNADIILMSDFRKTVEEITSLMGDNPFMLIGLRWNIELKENWNFSNPDWEARLRAYAAGVCRQRVPAGIDYYVFTRGLLRDLPPFIVGRFAAGNWMLYQLLKQGVPVIDATRVITAFHQSHDYGHQAGALGEIARQVSNVDRHAEIYRILVENPEARRNIELAGGTNPVFSPLDATWVLHQDGKLRRPSLLRRFHRRLYMFRPPLLFRTVYPLRPLLRGIERLAKATGLVGRI